MCQLLRDRLQLVADYKYDRYRQIGPGSRFIESLALWINRSDHYARSAERA